MNIIWFGKPGVPEKVLIEKVNFKEAEEKQYYDEAKTMVSGVLTSISGQELAKCIDEIKIAAAIDISMRGEIHPALVREYASVAQIFTTPYKNEHIELWAEGVKGNEPLLFPHSREGISA